MSGRTRGIKDVLWALALAGLVAGAFRLWFGLGATTNLTDAVPWGLWKILNMVAGVAISTSGFTVGFLVYVLKMERFKPLMKPAILVAFLGYGCSCLALLFDIGLPHRFWHPFVMWNEHSFLFEVFWCVILYFTVTSIELAPLVFDKLKAEKVSRFLHRIAFGAVIVGISLSSLHHSSLGSLFLVTPQRLHPLWYTPLLPLLFIISAMGAGMMFLVLLKILYARWYDPVSIFGPRDERRRLVLILTGKGKEAEEMGPARGRDLPMVVGLASIATGILGVYLLLQIFNLFYHGAWQALDVASWETWLFAFELFIAAVLPLALVWSPRTRYSPRALGIAAFSASAGLALNRLDVGIFGYFHDAAQIYFPSLAEWALSVGVVAAAGLAFFFFVENFPVFDDDWFERRRISRMVEASFDSLSRVWRTALKSGLERASLIGVVVVPLAWILMYPPYGEPDPPEVRPAAGMNVTRTQLRIDGNQAGVQTEFPHEDHKERLGGEESCVTCHHMALPEDETTPCFRCHTHLVDSTMIFDHEEHEAFVAEEEGFGGPYPENHTCAVCHTQGVTKTAETAKSCMDCHQEDTDWDQEVEEDPTVDLARAVSYMEAMHENCMGCHQDEAVKQDRPELRDCSTCHSSLTPRDHPVRALADQQVRGGSTSMAGGG